MTEEHWPTLEETEAEDKAAGRIDEAAVAEHRQQMREGLTILTALADVILAEEKPSPASPGERRVQ